MSVLWGGSDGPLLSCDEPRHIERVVLPSPTEPRKKCRQCRRFLPAVSFAIVAKYAGAVNWQGFPSRSPVCKECVRGKA